MKRIKHFVISAVLATTLIAATTRTVRAEPFWNCVTIWYIEMCYWVDENDPTQDDLFNYMWWVCDLIGLC